MRAPEPLPDPEIDDVLVRQISALVNTPDQAASTGAGWAAKRLRTHTAIRAATFRDGTAGDVVDGLCHALRSRPVLGPDGHTTIRGVTAGGIGSLNPAYVVSIVDPLHCRVVIAAYAKEGLIKQHTARRAVAKLLTDLPVLPPVSDAKST